ncbi:MAG: metal ABC transporter substrate-binding protein, partial [Xanthomonadales bacterium]|nr:metal ABC transporter substrate-binding protein [Xanthomonadales bacterium]
LLLLSACKEQVNVTSGTTKEAGKPVVLASNYPLYFFASQIAGDAADIRLPDTDGDPALWVPTSSDLSLMQNADLIILNGAAYESWLAFTSIPAGLTVDTTADIQDRLLPIENLTLHQHGPEGEHSHEGTAFTTWLDPNIAIEQARVIARELSLLVPAQAEGFAERLAGLEEKLSALDQSLESAFLKLDGQTIVFSHPVFQYLQHRYGLNGQSVHWEPDIEPGVKQWVDFQNLLREHPARLMIWEGQPSQVMIERLQQQGIRSVIFDPVANRPASSDYFGLMKANLVQLENE